MFEGFDGWLRIKDDDLEPAAEKPYTVSEFLEHCNFTLEENFADVLVEGEVASFKVNQGKWVFFDLKDDETNIGCFMSIYQLGIAITDGMKVRIRATPKLTRWGKFSLTVSQIMPIGKGSIKKNFELLKKKLTAEGLFDLAKKRPLPENPTKIGVISSTAAAGYIDFLKILDNRWGGLEIQTVNTQVQGMNAAEQIMRALAYLNQHCEVELIAILRGGGSADDLAVFNDERLVRAIAASRLPVITGIGHEVDESLADLAADVRASTPSNAAERLTKDRQVALRHVRTSLADLSRRMLERIEAAEQNNLTQLQSIRQAILHQLALKSHHIQETQKVLASLNPENILQRGYAIISGKLSPGNLIEITLSKQKLTAEIKNVESRATKS